MQTCKKKISSVISP